MDDALRKLAQSVKVIRSLHRGTGGGTTLYHGTGKTIDEFKPHTYFATAPETAKTYATYRRGPNPQTYRVEANLKRPAKMADYRKAKEELGDSSVNEDVFSHLESKGFDHFAPHDGEVVVFNPKKTVKPKFEGGGDVEGHIHPAHAIHGIHVGSNVTFTGAL